MSSQEPLSVTTAEVEKWICGRIGEFVCQDAATILPAASFDSFGIDSAKAISLMADLEEWLDLPDELPLELLFEAEAIAQAAEGITATVNAMLGSGSAFRQFR